MWTRGVSLHGQEATQGADKINPCRSWWRSKINPCGHRAFRGRNDQSIVATDSVPWIRTGYTLDPLSNPNTLKLVYSYRKMLKYNLGTIGSAVKYSSHGSNRLLSTTERQGTVVKLKWSKPSSSNDLFMNSLELIALGQEFLLLRGTMSPGTYMLDLVRWKLSDHISHFQIWTLGIFLFFPSCPGPDDPALILCSRLIQMPAALSAPWEGKQFPIFFSWREGGRGGGGRGNSSLFFFCQLEQQHAAAHAVKTGKGETCFQWFFWGLSKRPCYTLQSKDEEVPRIGRYSTNPPYPSKSNKGKPVFRDCVEWIEEFYWQQQRPIVGGTCFPHLARTRLSIDFRTFEKSSNETSLSCTAIHSILQKIKPFFVLHFAGWTLN